MARVTAWLRLDAPDDPNKTHEQRLREAPKDIKEAFETAMRMLSGLKAGDIDPWLNVPIHTIIRKSTRYIVFLDNDLDVQWWWLTRPDLNVVGAVQARISQLNHESAFLLAFNEPANKVLASRKHKADRTKARCIRSVMAEALALALNGGTQAECDGVLAEAQRNIVIAKDQHCRPIFLGYFFVFIAILGGIALSAQYWLLPLSAAGGVLNLPGWLGAAAAGAFGAFLSVLSRTRELGLEPTAGHRGLRIEALARTLLGVGGALLVRLAWHGGLFEAALAEDPSLRAALLAFLCLAAGTSERILPALVGRAEAMISGAPAAKSSG